MSYPIELKHSEASPTAVIRQWCAGQGHLLAGISWEIYGHWEESWNADASRIRTDVFHLLRDGNG